MMKLDNFKPYLIRALYEYSNDNLLTPYIEVYVNDFTLVPKEYVVEDKLILNISLTATKDLVIDNNFISFFARFSGAEQKLLIPIGHIISFYNKENGQGMKFDVEVYTSNNLEYQVKKMKLPIKDESKKSHLKIVKNKLS